MAININKKREIQGHPWREKEKSKKWKKGSSYLDVSRSDTINRKIIILYIELNILYNIY